MLSGGDPIPGEMKNKAPFDFVNTAKLLINTNSLPQTSDKTDAFYSRCILVEFGKQYLLGRDIIETIPQDEYDNFLTKSLRILRELLARGEFTNEGDIRAKEVEYERLSNPLTTFINTYYEADPDGKEAAWRLMDKYLAYCTEKGYKKPHSKTELNNMLKINYDVEKKNLPDDEDGVYKTWVWVFGIRPKVLSNLSNLSGFPLNTPIEKSSEKVDKTDKTDKNAIKSIDKNLSQSTILVDKKESCGICGTPLNGNSEQGPVGLGRIHPACKFNPVKVKVLVDLPVFVGIDQHTYSLTRGEIKVLPWTNAKSLILRRVAEEVAP
jgi:phage/plasmid-associated DNA primase